MVQDTHYGNLNACLGRHYILTVNNKNKQAQEHEHDEEAQLFN